MDNYKSFVTAIKQDNEEERRKRREENRRIIQERRARERQAAARKREEDKGIGDRIGDVLSGVGGFVKGGVDLVGGAVNDVRDSAVEAGGTLVDMGKQVVDDVTGESDRQRKELVERNKQASNDYLDGKITKEQYDKVAKEVDDAFRQKKKEFDNSSLQDRDATKSAAAVADTFLNAASLGVGGVLKAGGKQVLKTGAKAVGKEVAEETTKRSGKRIAGELVAEGVAFGGSQAPLHTLRTEDNVSGERLAQDALMGATVGGALTGAGSLLNKTVRDDAGRAIRSGMDDIGTRVNEFQAQPRSVRQGGFIKVPDALNRVENATDELVPTELADTPQGLSQAVKPAVPGAITPPDTFGVQFKSREQIMKDNKVDRPIWSRINEAMFDANAPLNNFAKEVKNRTGRVLNVEDDPHALAQLRNGMDEAGAARMQDFVNDMGYVRENKLIDAYKEYGVAQQVAVDRKDLYGKNIVEGSNAKLAELEAKLSPEELGQVKAAVQRTIDLQDSQLQRLRNEGFVSNEGYAAIKEFNPHYFTRFNLAEYIQDNQRLFASTNSNNIGKNIIQAAKGLGDDRKFIIEDPVEAITRAVLKTENLIQQNKVFHATQRLADDLPDMVVKLRNAEDVEKRIALSFDNKELVPVRNQFDRALRRDAATVRRLGTQINQLEKQGYQLSLKNGGERMSAGDLTVGGLGGDVPTAKTGQLDPNATDEFTDIVRQSERASNRSPDSQKAFGLKQDVIIEGAGTQAATTGSKLGAQDTQTVLRNLIENGSRADIDRLKKKVGTRDAKINDLLDEIGYTKSLYDETAEKINTNRGEIGSLKDADVPEGYEAVEGWTNGIKERIALPQYIADAYKGKNDAQVGAAERIMMAASKPFKAAATILSPAFLVKNSIRDTGTHWLTSQNISPAERVLIVPYAKRWVRGFMDSLTNSDFAQKVTSEGGGAAGIFNDRGDASKVVREVTKKITGEDVKTPANMFKRGAEIVAKYTGASKYAQGMRAAGRALEYAPRLAEARAAIEKGMSDPAAALAARNALGDLQNGGTVSRLLNNYLPFFNSIVQGNRRIVQSVRENPQKAAGMFAAGIALPAVSGYVWNRTMYPDVLNGISEYERENNWIIILGDNKDDAGRYTDIIKIPKNDAAKVFGNNIEVALDKMAGQDSQSFAELFFKTVGYAQPIQIERDGELSLDATVNSTLVANPLVRVPVEQAANHSFFTGRPLVSEANQGLDAKDQVTEKTPFVDRMAAEVGIEPARAAEIRGGISAGLAGTDPINQVKKAVTGASGVRGKSEFYTLQSRVSADKKKASNAINKALAAGDAAAAQDIAARYNEKFRSTFDPWIERYGESADASMKEDFIGLRLNLNSQSIKQRRKNISEKAQR